jgi:hypothetical protein
VQTAARVGSSTCSRLGRRGVARNKVEWSGLRVQLPIFPELELVRTTAVISHRSHGEFQMNKRLLLTAC